MQIQLKRFSKACFILLVLLSGQVNAKTNDIVDQLVKSNPVKLELKSSSIFAGRGDGVNTCPVTGEKITTKKHQMEIYGRTVYLCCHGCLAAAKKTPDKFIKPTEAEQQSAVKNFLAKAQDANAEEFCNE